MTSNEKIQIVNQLSAEITDLVQAKTMAVASSEKEAIRVAAVAVGCTFVRFFPEKEDAFHALGNLWDSKKKIK